MKNLFLLVFIFLFIGKMQAQTCLKGQIRDKETDEPLEFAAIRIYLNGEMVGGLNTDFDGNYRFCDIKAGIYEIEVSYSGQKNIFKNVQVIENFANKQNLFILIKPENFSGCDFDLRLISPKDVVTKVNYSKEFLRNQR